MFDAMKEKILMDSAFLYNLSKPYQQYTQVELANEIFSHKGTEELKVVINHNGQIYELYTIGCNNATDFLNKYHSILNQFGLDYGNVVDKAEVDNSNSNNNAVDQVVISELPQVTFEKIVEQPVSTETVEKNNQNDYEFFEFVVYPDTSFIDCFDKLLSAKKREKKDARTKLNGIVFDTVDCDSIEDLMVKYSGFLLKVSQQYQENYLKDNKILDAVWLFKTPRGNKYDGSEQNRQEVVSKIFEKTRKYQSLFDKKDQIDFNNSQEVYEWLISLAPYINNHALTLPVGLKYSEYSSQDKLLLAVLNSKGYTSENLEVNNIDDFYRQQIAFQMKQLEEYHFFVNEYSNMNEEDLSLTTQVSKDEAKLLRYKDRLEYCQSKLEELPEYEAGNINTNGGNFDKQIEILTNEIEELKINQNPSEHIQEINNKIAVATDFVKKALEEETSNNLGVKAGTAFLDAQSVPTFENIQDALNMTLSLSGTSPFKVNIIDGITNLARRYLKEDDEINLINEKLATIGINIGDSFIDVESEIQSRIESIEALKTVKAKRMESGKKIRPVIEEEIGKLKDRISKLNEKLGKEPEIEDVSLEQGELDVVLEEEQPFWHNPKLSEVAQEGSIFADDTLIDKEHSYLSVANAANLGYLNNEGSAQPADEKIESSEEEDLVVEVEQQGVTDSDDDVELDLVGVQEEQPFWHNPKLSEVAQEGSIFVDDTLIDKEHNYLSVANAANLGYLNSEEIVQPEEEKVESSEEEDLVVDVEQQNAIDSNDDIELDLVGVQENTNEVDDIENEDEEELSLVLTEEEIQKDSLFKFTVVEGVKKISKPLYDKISNIDFKQKLGKAVEFLGKHVKPKVKGIMDYLIPMAVTSGLALGAGAMIVATNPVLEDSYENDKKEESIDNSQAMGTIEEDIQNTLQENNDNLVSFDKPVEENTNDSVISDDSVQNNETVVQPQLTPVFEEESQNAVDQVLTGENQVYTNVYDAMNGTNVVDSNKLYEPSWQEGTPVDYYVVDNGVPELATKEEAEQKYNSGETVIQSVQNDGVTIGFVELNNSQEQTPGMTK